MMREWVVNKQKLYQNIEATMKMRGISKPEFEEKTKIKWSTYTQIRSDYQRILSIEQMVRISRALDVSIDYLLNENIRELYKDEEFMVEFLEKLTDDTKKGKIMWERDEHTSFNYKVRETEMGNGLKIILSDNPDTLHEIDISCPESEKHWHADCIRSRRELCTAILNLIFRIDDVIERNDVEKTLGKALKEYMGDESKSEQLYIE